jgi:hypothetical protein
LADARERNKAALRERERELQLSIAKLDAAVAALETALHIERSRVLGLPAVPLKSVKLNRSHPEHMVGDWLYKTRDAKLRSPIGQNAVGMFNGPGRGS